jgi:hypothetical protein
MRPERRRPPSSGTGDIFKDPPKRRVSVSKRWPSKQSVSAPLCGVVSGDGGGYEMDKESQSAHAKNTPENDPNCQADIRGGCLGE